MVERFWIETTTGCHGRKIDAAQAMTGLGSFFFTYHAQYFKNGHVFQLLSLQWCRTGQQLKQQHTQAIDVAARINIVLIRHGLLWAHVLERTDNGSELSIQRHTSQTRPDSLGHTEVDDFGHWLPIRFGHEHIGGFEVAVNDPFLMSMLNREAYRIEQFQNADAASIDVDRNNL